MKKKKEATEAKENTKNPFLASLDGLTAEELCGEEKKKKKKKDPLLNILLAICLGVFAVSAAMLVYDVIDSKKAKDIYEEINAGLFDVEVVEDNSGAPPAMAPIKDTQNLLSMTELLSGTSQGRTEDEDISIDRIQLERMKTFLADFKTKNPDIYGYIIVDNTNIKYPVVKGEDNLYYLDHDPLQKGYLDHGSIFADYCCFDDIDMNRNLVLYGHNMRSTGTMFHELLNFFEEDVFRNSLIYYYTEEAVYVYRPFAVFKTTMTYRYFKVYFDSDEEYVNFLYEMKGNSMFATDEEFTKDDKIITLSTCTNITLSGRYCVQGKLIRIDK